MPNRKTQGGKNNSVLINFRRNSNQNNSQQGKLLFLMKNVLISSFITLFSFIFIIQRLKTVMTLIYQPFSISKTKIRNNVADKISLGRLHWLFLLQLFKVGFSGLQVGGSNSDLKGEKFFNLDSISLVNSYLRHDVSCANH